MPANIRKKDLRIIKTEKALDNALFSLLKQQKFEKITVGDICKEALISRAAFYAHFNDKYDLLKYWLTHFKPKNLNKDSTYEQIEKAINEFAHKNEIVIKNIVYGANNETLEILFETVLSALDVSIEKNSEEKANLKYIVLSNIYVGGLVYYLLWLAKNNFPSDVEPMNIHLFEVINEFRFRKL